MRLQADDNLPPVTGRELIMMILLIFMIIVVAILAGMALMMTPGS
jgi:hypothetical protein